MAGRIVGVGRFNEFGHTPRAVFDLGQMIGHQPEPSRDHIDYSIVPVAGMLRFNLSQQPLDFIAEDSPTQGAARSSKRTIKQSVLPSQQNAIR